MEAIGFGIAKANLFDHGQKANETQVDWEYGFDECLTTNLKSRMDDQTTARRDLRHDSSDDHKPIAKTVSTNVQNTITKGTTVKGNSTKKTKLNNIDFDTISQLLTQFSNACKNMKNAIKEQLQLTDTEVDEVFKKTGLQIMDLFNPQAMQEFFLEANGVDDMSLLLTDETLALQLQEFIGNMQELMEQVEDLDFVKEFGFSLDEVKEMYHAMQRSESVSTDSSDEVVEENNDITPNQNVNQQTKETSAEQSHSGRGEDKKESEKEIKVTVLDTSNGVSQTKVNFMDQLTQTPAAKEIIHQIVKEIKVKISPNQTSMEMVLTPETLGRVNLTVAAKHGVMTAHLVTETQMAKEAIESQLSVLKEALEAQGLEVEEVEVTVATSGFDFKDQSHMEEENHKDDKTYGKKSGGRLRMVDTDDTVLDTDQKESSRKDVNASIGKGTQIDLTA